MNTTQQLGEQEKTELIARACGWKETRGDFVLNSKGDLYEGWPRYFHSLDAMAEAEKVLQVRNPKTFDFDLMQRYYEVEIPNVCGGVPGCWAHISATAAQRAESLGRTLSLW